MLQRSVIPFIQQINTDAFALKLSNAYFKSAIAIGLLLVHPLAQAASCTPPKTYYKNVSCTSNSSYYLASKDFGPPVALLDKSGRKVADLLSYQRVDAMKISEGLLPVQRNSRVGYIDMRGREVIPTRYDILSGSQGWARPASNGRIIVKLNGNYGAITSDNRVVIPFSAAIDSIADFKNSRAKVTKNNTLQWLDKNGEVVNHSQDDNDNQIINGDNPQSQSAINSAMMLQPQQQDGKWGYVDEQGIIMITYSFDEARPFSEGLAGVRIENYWGFVNLGGELVIPFTFDDKSVDEDKADDSGTSSFVFKNGKAWIGNLQNGYQMCINKEGSSVACD